VNREAFEVVSRKAQALRARLFSLRRIPTQQSVWHLNSHSNVLLHFDSNSQKLVLLQSKESEKILAKCFQARLAGE
jgi:hypothetical protein